MSNRLGEILRNARQHRGLTMRDTATLVGLSHAGLSHMENGRTSHPSPDILYELARVLGLNYSELMRAAGYKAYARAKRETQRFGENILSLDLTPRQRKQVLEYAKFLLRESS